MFFTQLSGPARFARVLVFVLAFVLGACGTKAVPDSAPITVSENIAREDSGTQASADARAVFAYLVSRDALRQGRVDEAAAALQEVVRLAPEPDVVLELAQLQWQLGLSAESRQTLKQGLEQFPDDLALTLRLARTYLVERRFADAQTSLELALARTPDDPDLLHTLAQVYLEAERYQDAEAALLRIPQGETTADTYLLLSKAALGQGQIPKAEKLLDQALAQDPGSLQALFELAQLYEDRNDYENAEKLYERLFNLGEDGREVRFRRIRALLKTGRADQALELARQGPDDFAFLFESARLFLAEHAYDPARQLLDLVEPSTEDMPEVHFFRGLLAYEGEQDPEAALTHLRQVPQDSSLHNQALGFMVNILLAAGRDGEAAELADQGLQLYPKDPDFPELKAILLQDAGDITGARNVLQSAMQHLGEDNPSLLYRLALVEEAAGDREASLAYMERVLVLQPDNPEALNFIGYVLALLGRDLDRALDLVKAALRQHPDSGYIMDSLAWVHYRRSELEQAWEAIRKAVDYVPGDPTIWEHFGDIAASLGKTQKAQTAYELSLRLGSLNEDGVRAKLDALIK